MKPNVLSLPTGAGSVEGLGESFEPQLNTGTGVYSVKISVPPGRAGFAPGLALSYNSGSPNSEFGVGWALSVPTIQRQTDKGTPTYSESDVYIFGGEELARLADQTWRCENEAAFTRFERAGAGWVGTERNGTRHFYGTYPNDESPSRRSRVVRGRTDSFDETYCWHLDRSVDTSGNAIEYFYTTFDDSPGRLYLDRVLYNLHMDSEGEVGEPTPGRRMEVRFGWSSASPDSLAAAARAATIPPEEYRARLAKGDPTLPPSRAAVVAASQATGLPIPENWEGPERLVSTEDSRPDALLDLRPGFHIRLARRCKTISVFETNDLVREYRLEYADELPTPEGETPPSLSLLSRLTVFGKSGTAQVDENRYLPPLTFDYTRLARPEEATVVRVAGEPRLPFENPNTEVLDVNADGLPDVVHLTPGETRYWLNEGTRADGRLAMSAERTFVNVEGGIALSDPFVQFADMDGDGATDLLQYKGPGAGNLSVRANPSRVMGYSDAAAFARFGEEADYIGPTPFALGDPTVQFLDLDFDKRTDIVISTPFGFNYYLNDRGIGWIDLGSEDFGSAAMGNIPAGTTFGDPAVQMADMNGDRMQDVVRLQVDGGLAQVRYWLQLAGRRWDLGKDMLGPTFGLSNDAADLRVMDVNGDGLADLVALERGEPARLRYWINGGDGRYGPATTFDETNSTLPRYDALTALRTADMNGNGMPDLVFANGTRIEFLDFAAGGPKPNLLASIDNGIGKRVTLRYKSSIDDMIAARDAGEPWTERPPFPIQVVAEIRTEFGPGFDLNEDGEDDVYRATLHYRDGAYDPFEKEFRGFRYADRIEWGDDVEWTEGANGAATPEFVQGARVGTAKSVTLVNRFRFHLGIADGEDNDDYPDDYPPGAPTATDERTEEGGAEEESLKGKPVWEEKVDGAALAEGALEGGEPALDDYVYTRTQYDYRVRRLHRIEGDATVPAAAFVAAPSLNGRGVSFAFQTSALTTEFEANGYLSRPDVLDHPVRAPAQVLKEARYDDYGNATLQADWGLVLNDGLTAPDRAHGDDERLTIAEFIDTPDSRQKWWIDRAKEQRVEDENGAFVSRTLTYYDGPDFIGLALGELGERGLATRVERFVNGAAAPASNENASDEIGDARLAANASVNESRTAYDEYGNAVAMLDPLGAPGDVSSGVDPQGRRTFVSAALGHLRSILYDDVFRLYPVRETIHLDAGKPSLAMNATYDAGLGVMETSTDFNDNVTDYEFDAYGRLTAIVKPGPSEDSSERPTQTFEYRAADPWTGRQLRYDRSGVVQAIPGAPAPLTNSVRTRLREDFADADGYHVLESAKFTDGLGRALMEVAEGEAAGDRLDATATGVVVSAAPRYGLRQAEFAAQLPYYRSGYTSPTLDALGYVAPPAGSNARTETFPDATGRAVRVVSPPETPGGPRLESLTRHLPRETHTIDEEQRRAGSRHAGAYMIHVKDGLDRLVEVREVVKIADDGTTTTTPVPWITRYDYDLQDNLVRIRDSRDNEKWMRHDGLGRKVFMNDADRGVMRYEYDAASNLTRTEDAKAQEIAYRYDGANRLVSEDFLDDAGPATLGHDYDPGQPLSPANRPDVLYVYDDLAGAFFAPGGVVDPGDGLAPRAPTNLRGMLAAALDLTGAEFHSYDERARAVWLAKHVIDPRGDILVPYSLQYRYDALDRVRDVVYPDGDAVRYVYDSRGQIDRIVGGLVGEAEGKTILSRRDFIASGQEEACLLGNGVRTDRAYDPRLRMNRLTHDDPGGAPLVDYAYEFDGASNILRIDDLRPTDPGAPGYVDPTSERRNTQVFGYDDLYRLTSVEYPRAGAAGGVGGRIDYRYDRIGNMLFKGAPGVGQVGHFDLEERGLSIVTLGAMTYGEAAAGQSGPTGPTGRLGRAPGQAAGPHALTSTASGRAYDYDDNGNMRTIDGDAATWDFKDRLFALENAERRADYRYDYSDRRTTKRVRPKRADGQFDLAKPETVVVYVDRLYELREGDNPVKYVFLGEQRIARATGTLAPGRERVQKLRLLAGWNAATPIVAPAGGSTARTIFGLGDDAAVTAVYRYEGASSSWVAVGADDAATPGVGYRILANAPLVRSVRGGYTETEALPPPPDVPIAAGQSFVGWPRFEPFPSSNLPSAVKWAAVWQAHLQAWQDAKNDEAPEEIFDPLPTLGAGAGVFVRSDGAGVLATGGEGAAESMTWILPDHLATNQTLASQDGTLTGEIAHLPFGGRRNVHEPMLPRAHLDLPYEYAGKESDRESNIMYFESRYYLVSSGRFLSVDSMVDAGNMTHDNLHCYAYCGNRPMVAADPTGDIFMKIIAVIVIYDAITSHPLFKALAKPSVAEAPSPETPMCEMEDRANKHNWTPGKFIKEEAVGKLTKAASNSGTTKVRDKVYQSQAKNTSRQSLRATFRKENGASPNKSQLQSLRDKTKAGNQKLDSNLDKIQKSADFGAKEAGKGTAKVVENAVSAPAAEDEQSSSPATQGAAP